MLVVVTHPDVDAWDAWHPRQLADRLSASPLPWYVAAGWSVDLFLGTQTREHEDLEVAVPAGDFSAWPPMFPELEFWVPAGPGRLVAMSDEALAGESHQTWAFDPVAQRFRFDVFREPHDGDTWICRRDDAGRIRLPYRDVVKRTADGIPYSAIELTLLFKAKHARDKDEADFEAVLPRLSAAEREWLEGALAVVHPEHPWRARLRDSA
jgi:hypothetical protein